MNKQTEESILQTSRRNFLSGTAAISALALVPKTSARPDDASGTLPPAFSTLKPLGSRVHPVTADEFQSRQRQAQKLMAELSPKYDALFIAPGTSLYYFT